MLCVRRQKRQTYNGILMIRVMGVLMLHSVIAAIARRKVVIQMYRNSEGYSDPTAGAAISTANKEEQEIEKLNHKIIQSFRLLVELAGFEIVGRVTLKHKKSGKVFK